MHDFAMDLIVLGLWMMALARLTRLLTQDEITDFIRVWVYRKWGEESTAAYFSTCAWCVGLWLSLATTWYALMLTQWTWVLYPILALGGSYFAGVSATNLEGDDDMEIEVERP
jgi:hypothetical protein